MSDQDRASKPVGPRKNRPSALASKILQEAFVANYVANGFKNGTAAAIAAGYAERGAAVQSSRLLSQPKIQEMIDQYVRRQLRKTDRLAMKTLESIESQAFSDITDVLEFEQDGVKVKDSKTLPKNVTRNIRAVRITKTTNAAGQTTVTHDITMHGVDKAKELLAHITGLVKSGEPTAADPDSSAESSIDRTERLLQLTGRLKKSAKIAKNGKAE